MARLYIGVNARGITVLRNVRKDRTGEPLILLDKDAVEKCTVNFAGYLEAGETISSATAVPEACSVSATTSSPNVTLTISAPGFDGRIVLTVTTSTGNVFQTNINVRRPVRHTDEGIIFSDYA